jgi:hypothetical protein
MACEFNQQQEMGGTVEAISEGPDKKCTPDDRCLTSWKRLSRGSCRTRKLHLWVAALHHDCLLHGIARISTCMCCCYDEPQP